MRLRSIIIAAFCLLTLPASAYWQSRDSNYNVAIASAGAFTGPGDVVSSATVWWGLRAYSAAARGTAAVNVCIPADAVCADLVTDASTGDLVVPTIGGSSCSIVTCTVKIYYDQTGNGRNLTQTLGGISDRDVLTANCIGSLWCSVRSIAAGTAVYTLTLALSQPLTVSTANKWITNIGGRNQVFDSNSNALRINYIANGACGGGVSCILVDDADVSNNIFGTSALINVSHAIQVVFNSGTDTIYTDGASVSGTGASTALAGTFNFLPGFDGNFYEAGIWPVAFSGTQQSNMNSNQHIYWGF